MAKMCGKENITCTAFRCAKKIVSYLFRNPISEQYHLNNVLFNKDDVDVFTSKVFLKHVAF